MKSRPSSIAELADRVASAEDFRFEFADFLDEFRDAPTVVALGEPPQLLAEVYEIGQRHDCILAATAETLAYRNGWAIPDWTFAPERSLNEPYFDFTTREGQLFVLKDSPAAFKSRNLFVTSAFLDRA